MPVFTVHTGHGQRDVFIAMTKLENIYKTLQRCAAELDRCAGLIRDAQFDPHRNIRRIAAALTALHEIQREIQKQRPDLIPKEWKKPVSEAQRKGNRRFGELLIDTEDLCRADNPKKAIQTIESFIRSKPGKKFEKMAANEMASIKSRFHL